MPKPELYVIFTGEKPENPSDAISLSNDFLDGEKIAIDAEIRYCIRRMRVTLSGSILSSVGYIMSREKIRADVGSGIGNDPYLQRPECMKGVSGK